MMVCNFFSFVFANGKNRSCEDDVYCACTLVLHWSSVIEYPSRVGWLLDCTWSSFAVRYHLSSFKIKGRLCVLIVSLQLEPQRRTPRGKSSLSALCIALFLLPWIGILFCDDFTYVYSRLGCYPRASSTESVPASWMLSFRSGVRKYVSPYLNLTNPRNAVLIWYWFFFVFLLDLYLCVCSLIRLRAIHPAERS